MAQTCSTIAEEMGAALEARERMLGDASGKVVLLCVAVALANGVLMALLATHPFSTPIPQLAAGSCAIALHGWGAWEVGAALRSWGSASGELVRQAAGAVCKAARGQEKKRRGV